MSQTISGTADKINLKSTSAALFFGVPNQGMNITALMNMVHGQPNEPLIWSLRPDSDVLAALARSWREVFTSESSRIVSFYETNVSPTAAKVSRVSL